MDPDVCEPLLKISQMPCNSLPFKIRSLKGQVFPEHFDVFRVAFEIDEWSAFDYHHLPVIRVI